ncbi:MAG: hypothetical protein FWB99_03955 [Treponema sp.]|nr:hypothetical protein [Treponema sp.]
MTMTYKRLGSMAILLVILAFPVSASMISFQLVETGLTETASSGQYSRLWESGLMSVFFDAGYIVTSSPIARMEFDRQIMEKSLNEAVAGGADYLVLGFIEYNIHRGRALPTGIVLRVYDSNSRQRIHEQNFPAGTGRNDSEEFQLAQSVGRVIISQIKDR